MTQNVRRCFLLLVAILLLSGFAQGQEYVERLHSPAIVRGFIGGESHDSYVIHARKGQFMTVQVSWKRVRNEPGENHAEFWVGKLPDFDGDGLVNFGRESLGGRRWQGRIPKTKDYYIYVMAHPTAHYTLRVTLR